MVHVGWVARCYTYSPPARVPHWSSGGGIQTTQDFVHNGSYGVGGWMMNFDSIGGHRGFEGWWGMYVKKGAHYKFIFDKVLIMLTSLPPLDFLTKITKF